MNLKKDRWITAADEQRAQEILLYPKDEGE
jgi:hypothetical protein